MTDKDLKQNVQSALDWEPSLDVTDIGLSIDQGAVTLRGKVGSYGEKIAAERAILRVYGVRAVANDLSVHLPAAFTRNDTEIAQAALQALNWNTTVPNGRVTLTVADGWVQVSGQLDWQYQKDAAARAVRDLMGVKGVTNHIVVKPHIPTMDVREKIEAAFTRSAEVDARRIRVLATGSKVILTGNVHSWLERQEAERAAWAAPGVTLVEDRITVVP